MTRRKQTTILWTAAGLVLSLAVLLVVLSGLAGQLWITDAAGIPQAADSVMRCIQDGNWNELASFVVGEPELEPQTGEENTAENLIWDAYRQSIQWRCNDGYTVQGRQVIQQLTVSCLDISELTRSMKKILPEITDGTVNMTADHALIAAAEEVLRGDIPMMQKDIRLSFVRKNGQWEIVPDSGLLSLLSGFTAG